MSQPSKRQRTRSYSWTSDNDTNISHRRLIGRGGFAQVHECFARKVIHPGGHMIDEDIEKEAHAIDSICSTGHGNIVRILRHGWFSSGFYYFIDMELCALNLDDYIYRKQEYSHHASELANEPSFVLENSSTHSKLRNIWTIIDHIAQGLEFIHEKHYVHRDLKPMNVLYSPYDNLWKIADFGLTTEGTSIGAITTIYSKGTEGYRAPELLLDDSKFNNKVDIWALGCILYELFAGKKAFSRDYQVQEFSTSQSTLHLLNPVFPENIVMHASKCIHEMLDKNPHNRPSISTLRLLLKSYHVILDPVIFRNFDNITSIAEYDQWKKFVNANSEVLSNLFCDSSNLEESMRKEKIARFLDSLVNEFPMNDWDSAIVRSHILVRNRNSDTKIHQRFKATSRTPKNIMEINLSLHRAAKDGNLEDMKTLLDQGADVTATDSDGRVALHMAAMNGREGVVALLLDRMADADVAAKDSSRWTALHWAAYRGYTDVVELLLGHMDDTDVAAQDRWGETALHRAAEWGHKATVVLLLGKMDEAGVAAKDWSQWTALDLAKARRGPGCEDVVALLQKWEQDRGKK